MKAAVLHAVGEPMRVEETRLAEPRTGEVLVRVQARAIPSTRPRVTSSRPSGRYCRAACSGRSRSEYRLEDINEAYARLPAESVGRGMILIEETA